MRKADKGKLRQVLSRPLKIEDGSIPKFRKKKKKKEQPNKTGLFFNHSFKKKIFYFH